MKFFYIIKQCLVVYSIFFSMSVQAQDFSEVTNSLRQGDVKTFSKNFDAILELTILDNEAIYSKTQIETILKEFFEENKPIGYETIHKGHSGNGAFFQIGELETSNNSFRTYIYAKNIDGSFLIQEFRIEEN